MQIVAARRPPTTLVQNTSLTGETTRPSINSMFPASQIFSNRVQPGKSGIGSIITTMSDRTKRSITSRRRSTGTEWRHERSESQER